MNKYAKESKTKDNWSCWRKQRYKSKEEADAKRSGLMPDGSIPKYPGVTYHCSVCKQWHIAKFKKKTK